MPRKSDIALPKRMAIRDAILTSTNDELRLLMQGFIQSLEDAEDWIERDPHAYRMIMCTETQYEEFYARWRLLQPVPPDPDPWGAATSYQLRDRMASYLLFRLKHSRGHDPSGKVRQDTLNAWSSQLLIVASFHIRGAGSTNGNRHVEAVTGSLPDRSDSIGRLLQTWCNAIGDKMDLPRRNKKLGFYGRFEIAMLLDTCDALMEASVSRGTAMVQLKDQIKVLFLTACRPGAMLRPGFKLPTNRQQTLHQSDLTITQPTRFCWSFEIDFIWLKGYTQRKHSASHQRPIVPATTKLINSRFDLVTTMVPRLIVDQVLGYKAASGDIIIFKDIEEFINCDSYGLVIVDKKQAVYRTVKMGPSRKNPKDPMTSEPASVKNLVGSFAQICQDAGLPKGRPYNCRHNAGDMARIVGGKEKQATVLHHEAGYDRGRTSYAHGTTDSGIARLVLGEFRPGDEEWQTRLDQSEYYARQKDGPAVHELVRRAAGISTSKVAGTEQQLPKVKLTKVELDKLCSADEDAVKLHSLWQEAKSQADADKPYIDMLHDRYQKRRKAIRARRVRELEKERKGSLDQRPAGTLSDFQQAYDQVVEQTDNHKRKRDDEDDTSSSRRKLDDTDPYASVIEGLVGEDGPIYAIDEDAMFAYEFYDDDEDADRPIQTKSRKIPDLAKPNPKDQRLPDHEPTETTNGLENALDTVEAFNDSDGIVVEQSEAEAVIAERLRLLRYHYEVLTVRRSARQVIDDYIHVHQCCPYCPLGAVTTIWPIFRNGKWAWDVNCIGTGKMDYHKHFPAYHPDEQAQIDAGIVPPFVSLIWNPSASDDIVDGWHGVLNDCLKMDLGEGALSEDDVEWYQQLYMTDDFVSTVHRTSYV